MADKLIMELRVSIRREDLTSFSTNNGKVTFLPFTATVDSELFCGKTRPGACDVQVTDPAGTKHMCARYILEGRDHTGAACHIYIENNAWFTRGAEPSPFEATPRFMTDSEALAPYLHGAHFRAEGHPWPDGVCIRIFDIDSQE